MCVCMCIYIYMYNCMDAIMNVYAYLCVYALMFSSLFILSTSFFMPLPPHSPLPLTIPVLRSLHHAISFPERIITLP